MIILRQKEYIAPLVAIGLAGTGISAVSAVKSHADNKEKQEELDKQNALIKAQNKKLEKLKDELPKQKEFGSGLALLPVDLGISAISGVSNSLDNSMFESGMNKQEDLMREQKSLIKKIKAKNSSVGKTAEGITKSFSTLQTLKGIGSAAKVAFGKNAASNVVMGTAMGGSIYAANKYVQRDQKKEGNSNLGNVALSTAATLGGLVAAKKGFFGKGIAKSINKGLIRAGEKTGSSGLIKSGKKGYAASLIRGGTNKKDAITQANQLIREVSPTKRVGKSLNFLNQHKGSIAMGTATGGVPLALGYQADKQMEEDMKGMTQQRTYGIPSVSSLKGIGKSAMKVFKNPKQAYKNTAFGKHPGQTLSGFASNLTSFGIGGTKNVQTFGNALKNIGQKQDNTTLTKAGDWIGKHKTAANVASIVPGAVAAKLTWDGSQKLTEKTTRAIDPKAYAYLDSKNQIIQ